MHTETYTPGHTKNATDFMSRRTLESYGQFFIRYLHGDLRVLDCGCGPGTITLDIASAIAPGAVTGIDFHASQIERARDNASRRGINNATFQIASCYALPFDDASFDCVFCHALMEHLADPETALKEFLRVLKPGGYLGVCSPDAGGFLLAPPSEELTAALETYVSMQNANGGDLHVGHKLGAYLSRAGFADIQLSARYECYPSPALIGEYLAVQLEQNGYQSQARTFHKWSQRRESLFAQAWVAAIGRKRTGRPGKEGSGATRRFPGPQAGMTPIRRARNIGPVCAAELRQVGIESVEKLTSLGWRAAWARLIHSYPARLNVNMGCALYGACLDCHWLKVPPRVKAQIVHIVRKQKTRQTKRASA